MLEDNRSLEEEKRLVELYPAEGDLRDKSVYILAHLKEGSAADIAGAVADFEQSDNVAVIKERVETILNSLLEDGFIHGHLADQIMMYRLK